MYKGLMRTDDSVDIVNHPPHYISGGIECIDVIESLGLGYHLGNAMKYIFRAGKKNKDTEREDIEKAIWYLNRYKDKFG